MGLCREKIWIINLGTGKRNAVTAFLRAFDKVGLREPWNNHREDGHLPNTYYIIGPKQLINQLMSNSDQN